MATRIVPDTSTYSSDENKTLSVRDIKKLWATKHKQSIVSSIGGWDAAMVRSAIEQQSTGDFQQSTKLARKMLADAAFSAAINKRVNSLIRSKFYMESEDETPSSKIISESMLDIWFDTIPEITIKNLLKNYLLLGVSIAYVTWEQNTSTDDIGMWVPNVTVYSTEFLKYNQTTCKWTYRFSDTEVEVHPGDGNWILLSEWEPGTVTGFVSHLGECWINKKFAERDQSVGNENHIDSICVVTDNNTGVMQEQHTLDDLASEIQNKKRDRVLTLPAGYSVSFQDAMSSYKPEAFTNVIEYADKKMQISILGGNLSSDVVGGSYAAAQTHIGAEIGLTESDEAVMSTELHKQLIKHVVSVNYGDVVANKYTPYPRWKVTEDDDLSTEIDTLIKIKNFIGEDYQIDNVVETLSKFGIVVKPKNKI